MNGKEDWLGAIKSCTAIFGPSLIGFQSYGKFQKSFFFEQNQKNQKIQIFLEFQRTWFGLHLQTEVPNKILNFGASVLYPAFNGSGKPWLIFLFAGIHYYFLV